jgi:PadR family transcriptional regulator PadR
LKVVALEPIHGWAVAQRIQQVSSDVLKLNQSSLYPALHRLEKQGWVQAAWGTSEHGRRAKYYSLTRAGQKRLAKELADWERLSSAISLVTRLA